MRGGGGILGEVGSGNRGRRPRVPARKVNCFSTASRYSEPETTTNFKYGIGFLFSIFPVFGWMKKMTNKPRKIRANLNVF